MDMTLESCRTFTEVLASRAPAPGGAAAGAVSAAFGTALTSMVALLTIGKEKYADVEPELIELQKKCSRLQTELLDQVEADEIGFLPLTQAFRMPKDDPDRARQIEATMTVACEVPMHIMELCCESIDCIAEVSRKCSRLTISDAGCAVVLCKSALQSAYLNIYANTNSLKNREVAEAYNHRAEYLVHHYGSLADEIFESVRDQFR